MLCIQQNCLKPGLPYTAEECRALLKKQLSHDADEISRLVPPPRNQQKKQLSLSLSAMMKLKFGTGYQDLLPQSLENQWFFRFPGRQIISRTTYGFDYEYFVSHASIGQGRRLQVDRPFEPFCPESFKSKGIRILTNFNKSAAPLAFQPDFDPDEDILSTEERHECGKMVLLLHDFYQHPLTISNLLNSLTQKGVRVVCPYVHDFLNACSQNGPNLLLPYLLDQLSQMIDFFIVGDFQIIAHGSSCNLALFLDQKYRLQCQKTILCSPLLVLGTDTPDSGPSFGRGEEPDTDTTTEMDFTLEQDESTGCSNRSCTKRTDDSVIDESVSGGRLRLLSMQPCNWQRNKICFRADSPRRTFTRTYSILPQFRAKADAVEVLSADNESATLWSWINAGFDDLVSARLSVFQRMFFIEKAADFAKNDLRAFQRLAPLFFKQQSSFEAFMRQICAFFVLAPLQAGYQYSIFHTNFDRHFFEALKAAQLCADNNYVHVYDNQQIYILVGSHDFIMAEQILRSIQEVNDQLRSVHSRTVLGAGHDLFSAIPGAIVRLLL